ncbi:MAG: hypothetical protein Q9190_007828 [Brigantiaea leucoxantha]
MDPRTLDLPRIVNSILDDLVVKCPLSSEGCTEEPTRGLLQDHLAKYCAYADVQCPGEGCALKVRRRDAIQERCLHYTLQCEDCKQPLMAIDLKLHQDVHCRLARTECPFCNIYVLRCELDEHTEICSAATFPCSAAAFGCDNISRRDTLDEHQAICPVMKIAPFLKLQNERLETHEKALTHLQHKNTVLETSLANILDIIDSPIDLIKNFSTLHTASDSPPFDSTTHHLLCLHESLRNEVDRVSTTISDLDTKTSMMVMNESLRVNEDMARTNATVNGMRMQLHWLTSARLQNQQHFARLRSRGSNDQLEINIPAEVDISNAGLNQELPRRLSDSIFNPETKL